MLAGLLRLLRLLFFRDVELVPLALTDELRQVAAIIGLGAQTMTYLTILGGEGRLLDVLLVDLYLLASLDIVEFN